MEGVFEGVERVVFLGVVNRGVVRLVVVGLVGVGGRGVGPLGQLSTLFSKTFPLAIRDCYIWTCISRLAESYSLSKISTYIFWNTYLVLKQQDRPMGLS